MNPFLSPRTRSLLVSVSISLTGSLAAPGATITWTSPGVNQSQVRVTGAAQIDGLIGLRLSQGYSPAVGSSNIVLTANPLKGTFHCYGHFMLLGQNERMLDAYKMLVCWPAEFTNFGLYFNTNLASSSWAAIPGATNWYLDSFSSAPQKFFLLIKPSP